MQRVDALRDELDPGAPRWRARLAVLARGHPGLVERLALRREDERAVEDCRRTGAEAGGGDRPRRDRRPRREARPRQPCSRSREHDSPALRDWFTRLRDVRLEVTGTDLAELGLPESPRVGEILEELRRRKLRGELDGREAELAAARELIAGD